jgi:hypothetical protein
VNAIHPHLARLGHLNQQQIQLLQRVRHSWQETVRFPARGGRHFRLGACAALVHVEKNVRSLASKAANVRLACPAPRRQLARSRPTRTGASR